MKGPFSRKTEMPRFYAKSSPSETLAALTSQSAVLGVRSARGGTRTLCKGSTTELVSAFPCYLNSDF